MTINQPFAASSRRPDGSGLLAAIGPDTQPPGELSASLPVLAAGLTTESFWHVQ